MKKKFLKILLASNILVLSVSCISTQNLSVTNATQLIQDRTNVENKLDVKFYTKDGDSIVAQILTENIDVSSISELNISDETLNVEIINGKLEISGLTPDTTYKNLVITLTDYSNQIYKFNLKDFTTPNHNFIGDYNIELNLYENKYIGKISFPNNIKNIKYVETSDKNIKVNISENVLTLYNLTEGKTYSELDLKIITTNNETFTAKINKFSVPNKNVSSINVKVSSYKNQYSGEVLLPYGIIPKEVTISNKEIIPEIIDDKVILTKLKPKSNYVNLNISVIDDKNNEHTFKLQDFSTLNKNYSYADVKLVRNGDTIQAIIILPEDLIITNAKFSDESLKFKIDNNNKLIITNLKRNTNYNNLKTIIQDDEKNLHNFVINKFSTSSVDINMDKLREYVFNAYQKAFDRTEVEFDGFNYWIEKLSNMSLSSREFILNILNTDEFIEIANTSPDKITRIYGVMYNRTPDIKGLEYWMSEYEKDFSITKDEKTSVLHIVKRMMDENEFKNIVNEIGIKY